MEQGTKVYMNLSNLAKTYMRISTIKSALTVFLIGYTVYKAVDTFKKTSID